MKYDIEAEELKKISNKIFAYRMVPFSVGVIIFLILVVFPGINEEIKLYIGAVIFVLTIIAVANAEGKIRELREERNRVYNRSLSSMIRYAHYEPERGFDILEVGTFGIIKLGKDYNSVNYFQGHYKEVGLRQADVVIYGDSNYSENADIINFFDGRIYEFKTDKISVQNVKVFSKGYDSRLNVSDYRVDVDNLLFNDNFDVYAPEPSEVAEVLTSEMMEHLLILQNRYKSIGFRFGEGKVIVAINGLKVFFGDNAENSVELAIMQEEARISIELIEALGLVTTEKKE